MSDEQITAASPAGAEAETVPDHGLEEVSLPVRTAPGASTVAADTGSFLMLASAPLAIIYLSFNNGGYFPNAVGLTAIAFCGILALRTTLAEEPFAGYSRGAGIAILGLAAFAALQLASAAWSHAPARSLDAYDRTFLYVLVLAVFGSVPQTESRIRWLVRGVAAAMAFVCIASLMARALPHVWSTAPSFYSARISYPVGYWNSLGLMAAVTFILLMHLTVGEGEPWWVRLPSAALIPAVATTLLLTYSRGAIWVAIPGACLYAVLARPRRLIFGLLTIGPPTAIALKAAYDATALSTNNPRSPVAVAQGHHVAAIVGLAVLAALILRSLSLPAERRIFSALASSGVGRRLPSRRVLAAVGAAVVVVVLVAAGVPGLLKREYDGFLFSNAGPNVTSVRSRLSSPTSSGRKVLYQVALKEFRMHKLLGGGAATYQNYSARYRTDTDTVTDAHSLYLQTLAENGLVGLTLLLIPLAAILVAVGVPLRRRPERSLAAALLAAGIAWAIHNGVDWDWQLPAVDLWLFAIGGLMLSNPRAAESRLGDGPRNRTALAVGWIALALGPLLIGFSYQRLRTSSEALRAGNCALAKERAFSSISLLAVRPQAYAIIGYCDLEQAYPAEALPAMRKAVAYDRDNWNYQYALAIAIAANGLDPRPAAARALALNPKNLDVQYETSLFRSGDKDSWPQLASAVLLAGLQTGDLAISLV